MKIAIPRERKTLEGRIALTPEAVFALVKAGHEVYIESEAGQLSGYTNQSYQEAGAHISPNLAAIYQADLIVKVKEPTPEELIVTTFVNAILRYLPFTVAEKP